MGVGLHDFMVYDCRHTFASLLVQGGVDLFKVSKLMGNAKLRETQRYAKFAPVHLGAAMETMLSIEKAVLLRVIDGGRSSD